VSWLGKWALVQSPGRGAGTARREFWREIAPVYKTISKTSLAKKCSHTRPLPQSDTKKARELRMKSIRLLGKLIPPVIRKRLRYLIHVRDDTQNFTSAHAHQIFDEVKTIFVHVPRTGGVSIETTLANHTVKRPIGGHQTSIDYQFIYPSRWNSYFTFGFVRNPWDRLVSSFFYLQHAHKDNPFVQKYILPYGDNLNGFLSEVLGPHPSYLYCIAHLKPQVYFLCNPDSRITIDFVGRYESLAQDWRMVCERIGIHDSLPHMNKSIRPLDAYQAYYTPDTADLVARLSYLPTKSIVIRLSGLHKK